MKKENFAILITSILLGAYCLFCLLNFKINLILLFFVLTNVSFIVMVYKILKSTFRTEKTFNDYFYMDSDIKPTKSIDE
jgi:hypothetical protein